MNVLETNKFSGTKTKERYEHRRGCLLRHIIEREGNERMEWDKNDLILYTKSETAKQ